MSPAKNDFDVVIVGAGVAGAMVAYRLAKAGARVVMLEAGIHSAGHREEADRRRAASGTF